VTIGGSGFASGATVEFGSSPATDVQFISAAELTAVTPAGTGTVGVTVTHPDGGGSSTEASAYTYVAPPDVTSVSPSSGTSAGGQSVTIGGSGFASGATVEFGSSPATDVQFISAAELTAVTPAGTGTVGVTVTNPGGGGSSTEGSAYAYVAAPVVPMDVGAPVALLAPGGAQKLIFWQGPSDDNLYEAWYGVSTGVWQEQDLTSALSIPSGGLLASAPTVVLTPNGGQQLVFWEGANQDLWEAWYPSSSSEWQYQDLTAAHDLAGAGTVAAAPTVVFTPGGSQQLVFWQGTNDDLWEAWYTAASGVWQSEDLSSGLLSGGGAGSVGSAPGVVVTAGGAQQLVFWKGTSSGDLWEAWYSEATGRWAVQDLSAARFPSAASVSSSPEVILSPGYGGQQLVFYEGAGGDLWEAWYSDATGQWQAQDLSTAQLGGFGSMASTPVVTVTPGGAQQLVFWETSAGDLGEAWYSAATGGWAAQNLTATLPAGAAMAGPPSLLVFPDGDQDVFWEGSSNSLWEMYYAGSWTYIDWTAAG
jgi:hypothetical protein